MKIILSVLLLAVSQNVSANEVTLQEEKSTKTVQVPQGLTQGALDALSSDTIVSIEESDNKLRD